jgi:hypothetical protein
MASDTPPKHRAAELERKPTPTQVDHPRIMKDAKKFTGFLKLPVEIKEKIYEHALRDGGHFKEPLQAKPHFPFKPHHLRTPYLPNVCCINKSKRSIATLVLVRNNVLRLSNTADITVILEWINEIGVPETKFFKAVKKVELCYWSSLGCGKFTKSLSFAAKCPVLTDLTLTIPAVELLENAALIMELRADRYTNLVMPPPRVLTIEDVAFHFELFGITDCIALQRLTLHISDFSDQDDVDDEDVDELAKEFQNFFMREDNQALNIEILCT